MADTKKKPSVVDAMADDTAATAEYPKGAPEFIPLLKLRPRSRRAAFKRKFGDFEQLQGKIEQMQKSGALAKATADGASFGDAARLSADLDDMYQKMDELLELAAKDPDAYRAWSDELDEDDDLTRCFNAYMQRAQPGEASSSAS